MIELLILYSIIDKELTMYGIKKHIDTIFAPYTKPSFGVIKPALTRLEKSGLLLSRKTMSEGGKQAIYYSITNDGTEKIAELMLANLSKNPVQFFSDACVKLSCSSALNKEDRNTFFHKLYNQTMENKFEAENLLNNETISMTFYQRITLDNTICVYNNLASLIENLEKENGSNS